MSDYEGYKRALAGEALPCALVDLDAVDRNADELFTPVRRAKKTLRVATKSLRCLGLLDYVLQRGAELCCGVMAFSVREAAFLVEHAVTDIVIGYPTLQEADLDQLARLNRDGVIVSIVIDSARHLDALEHAGSKHGVVIPVVVEIDMAYRPLGARVHLGVRRSPIRSAAAAIAFAEAVASRQHVSLHGFMGYESQIAAVGDANREEPALNGPKRIMRRFSVSHVADLRGEIASNLRRRGIAYRIFNGGGTGSIRSSSEDDALTEITAGSGFVTSHLFDHYRDLTLSPALFFALEVTRDAGDGFVVCAGGGYVASGAAGRDRLPRPWLPPGLALLPLEGAGEVQTPLRVPSDVTLKSGDVVLFRPAKAGELAERFAEYVFVRDHAITQRALTYRGMGKTFL